MSILRRLFYEAIGDECRSPVSLGIDPNEVVSLAAEISSTAREPGNEAAVQLAILEGGMKIYGLPLHVRSQSMPAKSSPSPS